MSAVTPTVLVTGGAGFIGSALCRFLIRKGGALVVNVDKLTYAANPSSLAEIDHSPNYHFRHADVCNAAALAEIFAEFSPVLVFHLAAESHVDRSIDAAAAFVETNVLGTFHLLEAARAHWQNLPPERRGNFRFIHVSTDEVYGSIESGGQFRETDSYQPSSPYSASKAGADHLVAAWHRTYGLPTIVVNSSNNFGPCQFPEKLIPLIILNCLHHKPLPIYGTGENVRDWIYVDDHVRALWRIAERGRPGEKYNVGARNERRNIEIVRAICQLMDRLSPAPFPGGHEQLITFVADRPGHDVRYALDAGKLETELGWQPRQDFATALEKTVRWYLENPAWWRPALEQKYAGERLGLVTLMPVFPQGFT